MLDHVNVHDVLFLDIETVPAVSEYKELSPEAMQLWNKKAQRLTASGETPDSIYDAAGIYAEFGKIICISLGFFNQPIPNKRKPLEFRIKSFYGDIEKDILKEFIIVSNQFYKLGKQTLCAHNGKEFDFPYLARRILINELKLPEALDIAGKKPWEINHLDTMALWKFGDYKSYSSLALLAHVFGIPTSKDDMDGSDVCRVYWKENNIALITKYCQKDVLTVAQLLLKYKGLPTIAKEEIVIC